MSFTIFIEDISEKLHSFRLLQPLNAFSFITSMFSSSNTVSTHLLLANAESSIPLYPVIFICLKLHNCDPLSSFNTNNDLFTISFVNISVLSPSNVIDFVSFILLAQPLHTVAFIKHAVFNIMLTSGHFVESNAFIKFIFRCIVFSILLLSPSF